MIRPNYREFRIAHLMHSAKGSTWEDHKYIKRIDGTYYYPDSYEGGRHLPEGEKSDSDKEEAEEKREKVDLNETDIENLAREVIRGNFGNGQERKDLLGENYAEIQKRVNELMKGSAGSKKVSDVMEESVKKVEEIAKKLSSKTDSSSKESNVHSGVDMDKVQSVYKKKK